MNAQQTAKFRLPAAEDDLWHQVVARLLAQRDVDEEGAREHLRLLEELAFHYWCCRRHLTYAFVENTATWLATEKDFGSPREKAQEWLADLERWELLVRRGSGHAATYEFPIPGLDEYFAARHLAARWVEDEERYRGWLPCFEGWWETGTQMRCPNPYCHSILSPFQDLILQAEHEETFLLMVGLLNGVEREKMFANGLQDNPNLTLKALSRCRHAHPDILRNLLESVRDDLHFGVFEAAIESAAAGAEESAYAPHVYYVGPARDLKNGFAAMGTARVITNISLVVDYFIHVLMDDEGNFSPDVRALRWIGHRAAEFLIKALRDKDEEARKRACKMLADMGDCALEPLIAVMNDEDRWMRLVAVQTIGQIWVYEQSIKPLTLLYQMIARFGDSVGTDKDTAPVPQWTGDARVISVLTWALKDRDEIVREEAVRALGKTHDARAVEPLLIAGLKDERISKAAAQALAQMGKFAVEPLLEVLRNNKDKTVRQAAILLLGEIGSPQAVEPLLIAGREDEGVRTVVGQALVQMGDAAVEPLIVALNNKDKEICRGAAFLLGAIGNAQAAEPLRAALKDENSGLRQAAVFALGKIGDTRAIPALQRLLDDPDENVRKAAPQALQEIERRSTEGK